MGCSNPHKSISMYVIKTCISRPQISFPITYYKSEYDQSFYLIRKSRFSKKRNLEKNNNLDFLENLRLINCTNFMNIRSKSQGDTFMA
jgi:hypothetical protein